MMPTLKPGEHVLCFNWAYNFGKPKIRDVVIVKSLKCKVQNEIVKRIQRIQGDKVYVVGDNKKQSTDSRMFGPILRQEIVGKVVKIV